MKISYSPLHVRYLQQAEWSSDLTRFLLRKFFSGKRELNILEVGYGTGAVRKNFLIRDDLTVHIYGLDLDFDALQFTDSPDRKVQADGALIPFASETFDFVYCHYLLLWVKDPPAILAEMYRVCKSEGLVAALAEPDYAALSARPEPLLRLAEKYRELLVRQGIDPEAGARLREWFEQAGMDWAFCSPYKYEKAHLEQELENLYRMTGEKDLRIDLCDAELYVPTYFAYAMILRL